MSVTAAIDATLANITADDYAYSRLVSYHALMWPDEEPAKHHRMVCRHLEALDTGLMHGEPFLNPDGGKFDRFMCFSPPGSAKTRYVSHDFPAWYLGRNPKKRVVACSHTASYATDNGGIVRDMVETEEYAAVFNVGLKAGSEAKNNWQVVSAAGRPYGGYLAAGVGQAIIGRRFDGGIIDDAIKDWITADNPDARNKIWNWYTTSFRTRRKPKAWIAIINQRWHDDDLCGRILPEAWEPRTGWVKARDGEWWFVLNFPALAEANDVLGRSVGEGLWLDYFGQEHWEQERRSQPPRAWSSMFQQRPTAEGGQYFQQDWLRYYGNPEFGIATKRLPPKAQLRLYMASDFAVTEGGGDFSEHGAIAMDDEEDSFVLDWWFRSDANRRLDRHGNFDGAALRADLLVHARRPDPKGRRPAVEARNAHAQVLGRAGRVERGRAEGLEGAFDPGPHRAGQGLASMPEDISTNGGVVHASGQSDAPLPERAE
jgi:hypothetical protein